MSLKHFHIVFICASMALMTFLGVWGYKMGRMGMPTYGLLACGLAGFGASLVYLGWFVRRYRYLP